MTDDKADKDFVETAEKAFDECIGLLKKMGKTEGCELLLRRGRPKRDPHAGWRKVPLADDFSVNFRKTIRDRILKCQGNEFSLLQYGAVEKGVRIGVALAQELSEFFDRVPKRTHAPLFDATNNDFSKQDKKCVHFSIGQDRELNIFGPSGASVLGNFTKSKAFAIWNAKNEVDHPRDDLLEIGSSISFFRYKKYVYVIDYDGFASATGYYEITQKRSQLALQEFEELDFVSFTDTAKLQSLIENSPDFAKRLSASSARGFIKNLDNDGLKNVLNNFAKELSWTEEDGVIKIDTKFKENSQTRAFKRMLAQVFVYCAATNKPLLSHSSEPFN